MEEVVSDTDWIRIRNGGFDVRNSLESMANLGLYRGGEEIIEQCLPPGVILNAELEEVIDAGVRQLASKRIHLRQPFEIAAQIEQAVLEHRGFALIRLGDAEMLTLAQGVLFSAKESELAGHWVYLCGVKIPDLNARNRLASVVPCVDIVGVPVSRLPTYQGILRKIVKHYGWALETMPITSSLINYKLIEQTNLYQKLLRDYRVLLIGSRMAELRAMLDASGMYRVVGDIPVNGIESVDSVLGAVQNYDFDVALVSAGIPACIICAALRNQGKVALDFGHLADYLVQKEFTL